MFGVHAHGEKSIKKIYVMENIKKNLDSRIFLLIKTTNFVEKVQQIKKNHINLSTPYHATVYFATVQNTLRPTN